MAAIPETLRAAQDAAGDAESTIGDLQRELERVRIELASEQGRLRGLQVAVEEERRDQAAEHARALAAAAAGLEAARAGEAAARAEADRALGTCEDMRAAADAVTDRLTQALRDAAVDAEAAEAEAKHERERAVRTTQHTRTTHQHNTHARRPLRPSSRRIPAAADAILAGLHSLSVLQAEASRETQLRLEEALRMLSEAQAVRSTRPCTHSLPAPTPTRYPQPTTLPTRCLRRLSRRAPPCPPFA